METEYSFEIETKARAFLTHSGFGNLWDKRKRKRRKELKKGWGEVGVHLNVHGCRVEGKMGHIHA